MFTFEEIQDVRQYKSITMAELKEVVKKLLGGRVPGMDELCPKMLKVLDAVCLSWLTTLFNTIWRTGKMPVKWQTRMEVPFF